MQPWNGHPGTAEIANGNAGWLDIISDWTVSEPKSTILVLIMPITDGERWHNKTHEAITFFFFFDNRNFCVLGTELLGKIPSNSGDSVLSLATCDTGGKPNISSHCFYSSKMELLSDFCLDVTRLCLLSKVTGSHFGNSIILLTSMSWTFKKFHYSQSMITKIHFPSGSAGITPGINCTHVYILTYTLAVVR